MSIIKKGDHNFNETEFKLKQSDMSYVDELGRHI